MQLIQRHRMFPTAADCLGELLGASDNILATEVAEHDSSERWGLSIDNA